MFIRKKAQEFQISQIFSCNLLAYPINRPVIFKKLIPTRKAIHLLDDL